MMNLNKGLEGETPVAEFGGQPDNYWEHSGIGVMGP